MVRLVVFDLDGTLIDSRRDLANATNSLIRELGGSPLPEEAVAAMVGQGAAVLVRRALAAAGLDVDPAAALVRFLDLYQACLLDTTRPYDGIEEVLETLAARMTLSVLTNKPARATRAILDGLNLAKFFNTVIGGDSEFPKKPDPAALLYLVREAGATPDAALMVGDSRVDLETARRAGTAICVARYGFGYRPDDADLAGTEYYIDEPSMLISALRRMRQGPSGASTQGTGDR